MTHSQLLQLAYRLCLKNNRLDALNDLDYLSYGELEGLVLYLSRLSS